MLRVAQQSRASVREYVKKLSNGATVAVFHNNDGKRGYWLARKLSRMRIETDNDPTTGVTKGECILGILWYDCVEGLKYKLLDNETVTSVDSIVVTKSNIVWNRRTTNRFYLGESTHDMLIDIVDSMSEL